jgi:hypothetical protein
VSRTQTNPSALIAAHLVGRFGRRRKKALRRPPAWTPVKPQAVNPEADWSTVFHAAQPFSPYHVPLPVRMGRAETDSVPPQALGNLELIKIPNFFHLTPPAIQKHCEALKPLCTPWPRKLPSLPVKIETRNYVFPGRSVRHEGSRKVVLSVRKLNEPFSFALHTHLPHCPVIVKVRIQDGWFTCISPFVC